MNLKINPSCLESTTQPPILSPRTSLKLHLKVSDTFSCIQRLNNDYRISEQSFEQSVLNGIEQFNPTLQIFPPFSGQAFSFGSFIYSANI